MTKKHLQKHDLLATPFNQDTRICLKKCHTYENKLYFKTETI